jgi:TonB family protein
MTEFMIRTLVIGGIATVSGFLFERGLAHLRAGTRFAWTFALLATLLLPLLPRLSNSSSMSDVVPQISAPAIVVAATSTFESRAPINIPLLIALILTVAMLAIYGIAFVRLLRARRAWRAGTIADEPVFFSNEFGPAVFGFTKPKIVVPEWVSATSPEAQALIVRHEREHIQAHDHLQLLLSIVATAAMPWNPFVWMQAKALRFRVETDCDQRVLDAIPDRARYAQLLVDVGGKQNGLLLTPALAEHRNGLERRLVMLANRVIAKRWKAVALIGAGVLATVVACESRLPSDAVEAKTNEAQVLVEKVAAPQTEERRAVGLPMKKSVLELDNMVMAGPDAIELIDKYYPATLRKAGVGGFAVVRVTIQPDGRASNYTIVRSAGNEALDAAALRVAKDLKMLPTLRKGQTGPVNYNMVLPFDANTKMKQLLPTRTPGVEAAKEVVSDLAPKELERAPVFTPYDVNPNLANREEVVAALKRNYPPLLRDAGITGKALMWVLVGADGTVAKAQLNKGSGRIELDEAAVNVAKTMKFTPATNKGRPVPVWIQLPIIFETK